MGKIVATEYTKPAPAEAVNPYIEDVREFADQGVDTPFAIETTAGEYKTDKLAVQKAVNVHGYSAREVEGPEDLDALDAKTKITVKFLVRPRRKPRTSKEEDATEVAESE